MGYMVVYRKSSTNALQYHHEVAWNLAADAADGVLLEDYELVEIRSTPDAYPLTVDEVLARQDAKAAYCKAYGENVYAGEESFARALLRNAHTSS